MSASSTSTASARAAAAAEVVDVRVVVVVFFKVFEAITDSGQFCSRGRDWLTEKTTDEDAEEPATHGTMKSITEIIKYSGPHNSLRYVCPSAAIDEHRPMEQDADDSIKLCSSTVARLNERLKGRLTNWLAG